MPRVLMPERSRCSRPSSSSVMLRYWRPLSLSLARGSTRASSASSMPAMRVCVSSVTVRTFRWPPPALLRATMSSSTARPACSTVLSLRIRPAARCGALWRVHRSVMSAARCTAAAAAAVAAASAAACCAARCVAASASRWACWSSASVMVVSLVGLDEERVENSHGVPCSGGDRVCVASAARGAAFGSAPTAQKVSSIGVQRTAR